MRAGLNQALSWENSIKKQHPSLAYRQLFGQLADHAVEVVRQALELLIGGLEEVGTPPGQEPQSPPTVVGVPYNPGDVTQK